MDKIRSIKGGKKETDFKKALNDMQSNIKEQVEFMVYIAHLQKIKYDALKEEGFKDSEALELCKNLYGGFLNG